jgi:hypothetical protein
VVLDFRRCLAGFVPKLFSNFFARVIPTSRRIGEVHSPGSMPLVPNERNPC